MLLVDCPWKYENWSKAGEWKNAARHYACMSLEELAELPVIDLCQKDAAVVMWATAPMLPQALSLLTDWGFKYSTAGAWAKRTKRDRAWQFGGGYVLRSAAEFFLIGTLGKPSWLSNSERNLIVAPIREHSRKPDQMYEIIEELSPGPFAELFARNQRPGWESWGLEVDKFEQSTAC